MSVARLIRKFAESESTPVHVNAVLEEILRIGVVDRLFLIATDLNPDILRGMFVREERPGVLYGPTLDCADVYYAKNQPHEWQRLVCCKEALHVFDAEPLCIRAMAELCDLVAKIALPVNFTSHRTNNGLAAALDYHGEWFAAALLFPRKLREAVLPLYQDGKLTHRDVCALVELPEQHVAAVLSDEWPAVYDRLLNMG